MKWLAIIIVLLLISCTINFIDGKNNDINIDQTKKFDYNSDLEAFQIEEEKNVPNRDNKD